MNILEAKKRIEAIINWSAYNERISLTVEDIEALYKAIDVLGSIQGFVSLIEREEKPQ